MSRAGSTATSRRSTEIERLAAAEDAPIVFNGDFHWFDAEPDWFAEIARRVARHHAIRGNVETEISRRADIGAGCGCAYPASVDEDTVRRSNEILIDLRRTAAQAAGRSEQRSPHCRCTLSPTSAAFASGSCMAMPPRWPAGRSRTTRSIVADTPARLEAIRRASRIDVFASTHTCLAALRDFRLAGRPRHGDQQRRGRHAELRRSAASA